MIKIALLFFLSSLMSFPIFASRQDTSDYVRDASCGQCHQKQQQLWMGSHHEQAMQKASVDTVSGDFNEATFNHHGEVTRFYKKKNKYFINTASPDGSMQDYEVKYTFGVQPLQQYLIELPGGRLQAFTIAWDQQQKKWFHLHPEKKMTPQDPLHWSKQFYNWNANCAACHSTNLQKNYDPKNKTYHTSWSEMNVGCQACHGPGKQHELWARAKLAGKVKNKGLLEGEKHQSAERCASCHSRRHAVSVNGSHGETFFDHFIPALLRHDLYHPDGQIKEEVFVYGSFVQSKMYRAGVTCLDCHKPHSLKLRQTGNGLCMQCHNQNVNKRFSGLKQANYNTPDHYHHKPGSAGAQCVNCHMPEQVYMQIDGRRDHSFPIPRPDLTEKIGVPNACNQCHTDKSAAWANDHIQRWFGKKRYAQHFGEIFTKARRGQRDVEDELIHLSQDKGQANIVRATAIQLLARYPHPQSVSARIAALENKSVLIRESAVRSLTSLPGKQRITHLAPLLKDPSRAVRAEVASLLADVPTTLLPVQYSHALQEYASLQKANLDLPSSYFNLGNLYQKQGKHIKAVESYQHAIALDASFYPAQQNLASLLTALDRKEEAGDVLRDAIKNNKEQGELYYSLGLLYAEQDKMHDARFALAKAAALLPRNARVQYNYALALQHRGDLTSASHAFSNAHVLNPSDPDIIYALVVLHLHRKEWVQALKFAEKLHEMFPESEKIKKLIDKLQEQQQ